MSQRRVSFAEGEYYHIYNRGNSKQIIFRDPTDHQRFQQLLYVMNSRESVVFRLIDKNDKYVFERGELLVAIGAYCLMPNHFHILMTPLVEGGVQTFMRKVSTAYSMYFNKRYERTGILFEGRFKSQHADTDEYLKYLFSYIHLNPLKLIQSDWKEVGLDNIPRSKSYLDEYTFSSYQDFLKENRAESTILDITKFPKYFPGRDAFLREIKEWMVYKDIENR